MDYYYILLSSDDLIKLQHVCREFYHTLQSKTFWKEKSDQDRIEPGLSNMREWIIHRRALLSSMLAIPQDGLEIKITKDSPFFDGLYQTLLDKERQRVNANPLQLSDTDAIIFTLKRGRYSTVLYVALLHCKAKYNLRYKNLNQRETSSFIYQVNRGTCRNIM